MLTRFLVVREAREDPFIAVTSFVVVLEVVARRRG